MKTLILMLLVTASIAQSFEPCSAQMTTEEKQTYAVAGFSAGYSKNVTAGLQVGVRTGNIYLSVDELISLTSNATVPKIFIASAGYNIGSIQPFISYSYQTIGRVSEAYFHGTSDEFNNGFKLGGGIKYYFKNFPLSITAQRQGRQNNLSIGIYKAL